jgi:hypothetical protein
VLRRRQKGSLAAGLSIGLMETLVPGRRDGDHDPVGEIGVTEKRRDGLILCEQWI